MYLADCLNSIVNQTYKHFELILINDCSTDNSMEIIQQFEKNNPNINLKIISHTQNSGQSVARNNGIKHASGKYLLFIDSDDSLMPNTLSHMVSLAEKNDLQLVIGENYIINGDKKKYISVDFDENIITNNTKVLNYFVNNRWYNPPWNKLLRTDFVIKNNLFFKEGYIFEDELWSFILATKIERMGVVREPLYNYYIRPNSTMTNNQNSRRWFGLLKILPFMKNHIFVNNLQKDLDVSKFFLFKLIVTLNGLKNSNAINFKIYKQIKQLNYISFNDLFKNKYIKRNEYLCYLHLSMPSYLGYAYYKCTELYYKYR